jgi:hypothetical protein
MLRHACGLKPANDGVDTRSLRPTWGIAICRTPLVIRRWRRIGSKGFGAIRGESPDRQFASPSALLIVRFLKGSPSSIGLGFSAGSGASVHAPTKPPLYPGRRTAANLMTKDGARRVAANVVKLPELIDQLAAVVSRRCPRTEGTPVRAASASHGKACPVPYTSGTSDRVPSYPWSENMPRKS